MQNERNDIIKLPPTIQHPFIKLSHELLAQATQVRQKLDLGLLKSCNITLSEKEVLARLHKSGGQMRMSDISDALKFTEGGTTKMVTRLTKRGFVSRQRSEQDGRVVLITISEAGTEKLTDAIHVMAAITYPLLSDIYSLEECDSLTSLLKKLNDNA
jgi:DNA-binding MarR family transcriptional regulator